MPGSSRVRGRPTLSSNASCGSWSRRRLRPHPAAFAVVVTLGALFTGSASAEQPTVTSQARAANAEFLAFAPPPPEGAGAVCLVDTGVDLNPDTESNVVERLALDGGDPGDVHHTKHGTSMAMVMGGPVNDWGSVGIWPHVRIVSIRAMPPGESSFPFNYYKRAVDLCGKRLGAGSPIRAVNLSLGGAGATRDEIIELEDYVAAARQSGLNVVAAAGNDAGAVQYPAAIDHVLAVGAADRWGGFCDFSSRGPDLDVAAPGCDLDVALPDGRPARGGGTSDSSAMVATVLTALRSYRPGLGHDGAEALLLGSARPTSAGSVIDVEAAFHAAGLGHVVQAGSAATPPAPPSPPSSRPEQQATGAEQHLPRPRLRSARVSHGRLILRLANRPDKATVSLRIAFNSGRGEFRRRERLQERNQPQLNFRPPRTWTRIELRYTGLEAPPSRELVLSRRSLERRARSDKRPSA